MRENNKYNMYNKYNQVGCDEVGYRDILKLYLLYELYMLFLIIKNCSEKGYL